MQNDRLTQEESTVVEWASQSKLLPSLFGDLIHREIISRSMQLLSFLAELGHLNFSILEMAWKTAINKDDHSIQDALIMLLADITIHLDSSNLTRLIRTIIGTLESIPGGADTSITVNTPQITAMLAQKLQVSTILLISLLCINSVMLSYCRLIISFRWMCFWRKGAVHIPCCCNCCGLYTPREECFHLTQARGSRCSFTGHLLWIAPQSTGVC